MNVQAPDPGPRAPGPPAGPSGSRAFRRLVKVLVAFSAFLILLLAIRAWVLTPFRIPTASMEPTLLGDAPGRSGDTILVNRLAYIGSGPARWDVVAFESPEGEDSPPAEGPASLVKRVVGLPGEEVEIAGGDVFVNGQSLQRPPGLESIFYSRKGNFGWEPVKLGPREYFVLGDNADVSQDSRRFGPIPRSRIFGRVDWILLPWRRSGRIR